MIPKKNIKKLLFLLFFLMASLMVIQRHYRTDTLSYVHNDAPDLNGNLQAYNNYKNVFWADKAGYYVYLPALFKYDMQADKFNKPMDSITGFGFNLNKHKNTVETKYTYGVALLQLPFYFIADVVAKISHAKADGFSTIYQWAVNMAAVFYLMLGLFFLRLFLKTYRFTDDLIYTVLALLFLGTNLWFYAIDETSMSHVYLFALFSVFLYLLKKSDFLQSKQWGILILLGLLAGLILISRPTNILFLSVYFFLDATTWNMVLQRIKRLFSLKLILLLGIPFILALLPQLLYWKTTFGSWLYYSYQGETFDWTSPQILKVWFSANNGLFIYSPLYILAVLGSGLMIIKKKMNAWFILLLFLSISYVFSCWWIWSFGCSCGGRSFVEYLSLLALPIVYLFDYIYTTFKRTYFVLTIICIGVLLLYSFKIMYSFDECFFGSSDWDYRECARLLLKY